MLFASGEGQDKSAPSFTVNGLTDQPPRNISDELFLAGEKSEGGAAKTHGHAQALPLADGDIGAEIPRRLQQRQGQRLARDRYQVGADGIACRPDRRQFSITPKKFG
jgi:hypothetical protein